MSKIIMEICQQLAQLIGDCDKNQENKYYLLLEAITEINNPANPNKRTKLGFDTTPLMNLLNQEVNAYFIKEIEELILDYIKYVNENTDIIKQPYSMNENFFVVINIFKDDKLIARNKTPYPIVQMLRAEQEKNLIDSLLVDKKEKTALSRL